MNANLTEHMKTQEFVCRCGCGLCEPTPRLLKLFEDVRGLLGVPMYITSGQRCAEHNSRVGGAAGSQHVKGNAVDFYCRGISPERVYTKILRAHEAGKLPELGAIGFSKKKGFVHIDAREVHKLIRLGYD